MPPTDSERITNLEGRVDKLESGWLGKLNDLFLNNPKVSALATSLIVAGLTWLGARYGVLPTPAPQPAPAVTPVEKPTPKPVEKADADLHDIAFVQCCGNDSDAKPAVQPEQAKDKPQFYSFQVGIMGRGYKPPTPEKRAALYAASNAKHAGRLAMLAQFQALPAAFDCREKGWVLPVGDQGNCGSCYLYSTAMTLSQAFVKAGYGKNDGSFLMSVQFGMDCHDFGGCGGGNGTEVIDWALKNGWYAQTWVDTAGVTHNDYPPYEARSRSCRKVPGAKLWKPADWGFVSASQNRPATTLEIKTALMNYGPLNVSLDAGGQFGNGTGTITSLGGNIDHEIELVAYDDAKDGGAFLLKNQWSKDWGNQGYRWVTYKAAQNLVDVFFVTATALPPPPDPVPPTPPAPPTPGKDSVKITITQGGKVTETMIPLTPAGSILWPSDTPQWLKDAVEKQKMQEVLPKTSMEDWLRWENVQAAKWEAR